MERTKDKIEADLILLNKALQTLKEALNESLTDIVRDAVIQLARQVYDVAKKFPPLVEGLLISLKRVLE